VAVVSAWIVADSFDERFASLGRAHVVEDSLQIHDRDIQRFQVCSQLFISYLTFNPIIVHDDFPKRRQRNSRRSNTKSSTLLCVEEVTVLALSFITLTSFLQLDVASQR